MIRVEDSYQPEWNKDHHFRKSDTCLTLTAKRQAIDRYVCVNNIQLNFWLCA